MIGKYSSNVLSALLAVIIGGFIYAYVLVLTKGIDNEDLKLIPSAIIKLIPSIIIAKIKKNSSMSE